MKKVLLFVLLSAIIFFAPSYVQASAIVTADEQDFVTQLGSAIETRTPILIKNQVSAEQIQQFEDLYINNNSNHNQSLNSADKQPSVGAVVIATDSEELRMIAEHIALMKHYDIYMDPDLPKEHPYEDVLIMGHVNVVGQNYVKKYVTEQEIRDLYNELLPSPDLYVYVESKEYRNEALYMAVFRKGRLIFDLGEIPNHKTYLAWFVTPKQFSGEKYAAMFHRFDQVRGIGVLMASTPGEVNLLLNRSFYYDDLQVNKLLYRYSDSNWVDTKTEKEGDWIRITQGERAGIDPQWLEKASYINIFAHGAPSGFRVSGASFQNFPSLNAPVIVAESCSTLETLYSNNIALDAISKGAVAYVGSFKVGGADGNLFSDSDSYLMSYQDVPLSRITKLNNKVILKSIDTVPRAVMIGDPLFYYIREGNPVVQNGASVELKLPFDLQLKKNIYFPSDTAYHSITEVQGQLHATLPVENYDHVGIVSMTGKEGSLILSTRYSVKGVIHKFVSTSVDYVQVGISQVIENILFIGGLLVLLTPFMIEWYRYGAGIKIGMYSLFIAMLYLVLEHVMFGLPIISWKRLIIYSITLFMFNTSRRGVTFKSIYMLFSVVLCGLMVFIVLVKAVTLSTWIVLVVTLLYYSLLFIVQYFIYRYIVPRLASKKCTLRWRT